jgi:hypothetical protein
LGAGGAGGLSRFICFTTKKMQNATMVKSMIVVMNAP